MPILHRRGGTGAEAAPEIRTMADLAARRRVKLARELDPWDGSALLRPKDAAAVLQIPEAEFRRDFIQGRRLPVVSLSVKRPRVRAQDLAAYIDGRTVRGVGA